MADIQYDYTGPGASRIRTTAAAAPALPPVQTSSVSAAAPNQYAMPDMAAMLRWAAQQRAQREEEDEAKNETRMRVAQMREDEDAHFARALATRQQAMREAQMRQANKPPPMEPYFTKMVTGPNIIGGYRPAQHWEAGAVAAGHRPTRMG